MDYKKLIQNSEREIIYTESRLKEVLEEVEDVFSFDIETSPLPKYEMLKKSALDPYRSFVSTISFASNMDKGYVIPLAHNKGRNIDIDTDKVFEILKEIFVDRSITKIAFNLPFEQQHLLKYNCFFNNVADPLIMAISALKVKDPDKLNSGFMFAGMGLKDQSTKFLDYEMDNFTDTVGDLTGFAELDIEEGAKYAIDDSVVSLALFYYWKETLENIPINDTVNGVDLGKRPYTDMWQYHNNVDGPTQRLIGFMEYHGIHFNRELAEEKKVEAEKDNLIYRQKLKAMGDKYNIKISPGKTGKTKSVRKLLFEKLKSPVSKRSSKTGAPSLSRECISDIIYMMKNNLDNPKEIYCDEKYKDLKRNHTTEHENKDDILEVLDCISRIQKNGTLVNSHIKGRVKYIKKETGRIHSKFNCMTRTGRFASSKPNAQNIPRADNDDLGVRNMYSPEPGNILILIDYAGQELRLGAEIYKDETMKNIVKNDLDLHSHTARSAFNLDVDLSDGSKVEKKYRNPAKPIMFTMTYGGGAGALQKTYKKSGIYKSFDECDDLIAKVKAGYPGINRFAESVTKFAEDSGYVETVLGFRRYLTNINSHDKYLRLKDQRRGLNTPVQGTAAEVTKAAMNRVYDSYMDGSIDIDDVKMISTIHDEIAFEIKATDIDKVDKIVSVLVDRMEQKFYPGQEVLQKAEPEVADPFDVFNIGESNGWAEKYDFYKWKEKVCKS